MSASFLIQLVWTLFLSGVLPHVPRMLPVFISDPDLRAKAAETFTSEEFQNNIEEYFVQNIKVSQKNDVLYLARANF